MRLGMARSKVKAILGTPQTRSRNESCDYYSALNVFYKRGRVVTIEVKSPRFKTLDGSSLGSSFTRVHQRFAPLKLERGVDAIDMIAFNYSNPSRGIGFCFQVDEPKGAYTNNHDRLMNASVSGRSKMLSIGIFRPGTNWKMYFPSE